MTILSNEEFLFFLPLLFIHESFKTTKSCNNIIMKIQDTIIEFQKYLVRSLNIQYTHNTRIC